MQAFSSYGEQGLLFIEVRRLLSEVASLKHGPKVCELQYLWHTSLAGPQHDLESSQVRDQTHVPCIAGHIPIHCATVPPRKSRYKMSAM